MGCSWRKNPGVKGKFLISITVFNKFQIDLSSDSVKCRPLAIMLQWAQTPPTGCNSQYPSLPFFPAFPPTFQTIKITVLQFLLEKSIYGSTVIGRDHQNREESGKEEAEERWGTEEFINFSKRNNTFSEWVAEEGAPARQSANCHMPWQRYRQQQRARGAGLSLAPHPAVVKLI